MATEGMGAALQTLGSIRGCHAIQYPSGRWGLVGRVPAHLAYVDADGNTPSPQVIREIQQFGGVAMRSNGVKSRTWNTESEALAAIA